MSGFSESKLSMIGGTIVASVLAIILIFVVSTLAAGFFAISEYYLSSMRAEAALFLGQIFGGFVGPWAAKASCDSVIKNYASKAVFIVVALLCCGAVGLEFTLATSEFRISRLANLAAIVIGSWFSFWREDI